MLDQNGLSSVHEVLLKTGEGVTNEHDGNGVQDKVCVGCMCLAASGSEPRDRP